MAITKILARNARLDQAIQYVLNGDKTDSHILTAHQNCDPGRECRQMLDTKREVGKLDGRQCYHIIQSFQPGEITPELALEIAKEFSAEYLTDYEVVIGTHVDKGHIHSHIVFNSVNAQTGEKYHVTTQEYYRQIRAISDRLCREHGLSIIMQGQPSRAVSYIEWLRQSKGQPTFRTMLEADLRTAIEGANDLGHFFLLMEHMGYEIYHGNRLGFRLRGQDRFMYPERKDPLFSEDGIRAAIQGNLEAIEAGLRPAAVRRPAYRPYKKHPKYTGLLALYVHYLYVLGKVGQRRYPPRMTPQLRQEVMKAERYRVQFAFLRENDIVTQEDMTALQSRTEETLASLTKQRTILNVRKKKRRKLYDALADVEALAQARQLYEDGLSGMEKEFTRYMDAVAVLDQCGIPRERLTAGKADIYGQLAKLNHQIRAERKKLALCREICSHLPQMEQEIQKIEMKDEVIHTLGEKKCALYAVIPDNDNSLNFLVSLLYAQAFQALYYSADQIHHGALPQHVHFVLDEFAAMPLPGFTRELATMRSRNISASTIIQNMAQIKELYKDSWETIPGNSDTILYLGGNESSTHKYISEALGKSTINTKTHGQSKGRSGSYSTNFQTSGRELLAPDEVRALDNRYAILFIRGAKPVLDLKYELMNHPAIRHTADGGGPPYIHHQKRPNTWLPGASLFAPEDADINNKEEFEHERSEEE